MLTVLPANLDDSPAPRANLFKKLVPIFYILIFLVSLFFIASNSYWLKYFAVADAGLTPIANLSKMRGEVVRKTILDSLWLPLKKGLLIYNADQVITEDQALAEILFADKAVVTVKENSKARISLVDGMISLRVSQGEVQIRAFVDQNIRIQRGSKIEVVMILKGIYTLNIDSAFGVQFGVKISSANSEKTPTPKKSEIEKPKDEEKNDTEANADTQPGAKPRKPIVRYALPTPKDGTVFLGPPQNEVIVAARRTCPDICSLKIFKNHQLWKNSDFKFNEEAVIRLAPAELGIGLYDWVFASETVEFRSTFVLKTFSDEELFRALEKKLPVEIR